MTVNVPEQTVRDGDFTIVKRWNGFGGFVPYTVTKDGVPYQRGFGVVVVHYADGPNNVDAQEFRESHPDIYRRLFPSSNQVK